MTEQAIFQQLQLMPPSLQKEVLDFIGFLLAKHNLEQKAHRRQPKFGSAKGRYRMSVDFDEPLDVFKEYME